MQKEMEELQIVFQVLAFNQEQTTQDFESSEK